MKKFLAIFVVLAMVFAFAACGGKTPETTTEEPTEEITEEVATEATEEATEEVTEEATEEVTEEVTEEDKLPETKEEILAAYAEVMNQAKKDAPGFTKIEWQTLPADANSRVVAQGESVVNTALNLAQNNFMTSEADTKKDPEIREKGTDMHTFPICDSLYGCLLTNPDAIKSAKCEELSNGNYKITITLNSEKNPEPVSSNTATSAPSNHGGVFSPVSKKVIDDTLSGGIVSAVAKDITYSLTYHDCSTTLEYNPENNHVVSLVQYTKVTISGSGKIAFIKLDVTKQELVDEMHIYNVKY